jgi:hypothetical protein
MNMQYEPQFIYTAEEFVIHFGHFVRSPGRPGLTKISRYFLKHYPDPDEASWKMSRFAAAFFYMWNHALELKEFITVEGQGCRISGCLVVALAQYFCPMLDEHLPFEPNTKCILKMAKKELERIKPIESPDR